MLPSHQQLSQPPLSIEIATVIVMVDAGAGALTIEHRW